MDKRFQDQQFRITQFYQEVAVECPACQRKAFATVDFDVGRAKLICTHCGFLQVQDTTVIVSGIQAQLKAAAHSYFRASLWYQAPFKDDYFFAYNEAHLLYLEQYIGAQLREHKNRTHFTLIEKLPKFYHEAKNRTALLKLIGKLKDK